MAELSIKDFDEDLLRRLRAQAALKGLTMRSYVTSALQFVVDNAFDPAANTVSIPARGRKPQDKQ